MVADGTAERCRQDGVRREPPRSERVAIETFLQQAVDLDDVVDRTVRLLSSLTHQVAVMQYPSIGAATVRHVELVSLTEQRLMVVLIMSTGRVEQRILALAHSDDDLPALRAVVNELAEGKTRAQAADGIAAWVARQTQTDAQTELVPGAELIADFLAEEREERVAMAGTAHLVRSGLDFPDTIGPVLDALEEHVVLLRLFQQMAPDSGDVVAVRIGGENAVDGLRAASVVSAQYTAGGIGVLGPTRMDYPTTMAAVRAVARYVSEILEQ